jgi:hypothetical protein
MQYSNRAGDIHGGKSASTDCHDSVQLSIAKCTGGENFSPFLPFSLSRLLDKTLLDKTKQNPRSIS